MVSPDLRLTRCVIVYLRSSPAVFAGRLSAAAIIYHRCVGQPEPPLNVARGVFALRLSRLAGSAAPALDRHRDLAGLRKAMAGAQ